MQAWSNFPKSINVILHINIIKNQNLHEHLNRYRRVFDKIQHSFMIKTLNKLETEGNFANMIKNIHTIKLQS